MMPMDFLDRRKIGGKPVYIVDDHHKALAAWAIERRKLAAAPYLITIDHHSDTDDAFRSHVFTAAYEDPSVNELAMAAELVAAIDWSSNDSVLEAIGRLRHDEHIHAATKSGTLTASFSIQLWDHDGYMVPEDGIYVVSHECAIGCQKKVYDDECVIHHALEIINAPYLEDQLRRIGEITLGLGYPSIESLPYILDIDLDAFHSIEAANPRDASTFRRLIRGALAVTIATEQECVEDLWADENNEPSCDLLLTAVIGHIVAAMG